MTALLVATPGGHLTQLLTLLPRLVEDVEDAVWVSSDNAQARSALDGREVVWTPYASPRDLRRAVSHAREARRLVRSRAFDVAFSTGASHAVPFLAEAARAGVPAHFIDSATRVSGPSLSGRLMARVPGVTVYSQYRGRAAPPWRYGGSVFEGWTVQPRPDPGPVRRVFLTLGSAEDYGFRRLVERLLHVLPDDVEVVWQTGSTDVTGLPITGRVSMPSTEVGQALAWCDVVVAHAGTGSALSALAAGKVPVLVPRSAELGEHVDDHQAQIADELARRGLAVVREASSLALTDLVAASALQATPCETVRPFGLVA